MLVLPFTTPSSSLTTADNLRTLNYLAMLLVAVCFVCMPDLAFAEPWDDAAKKVVEIFTGGLARTLAVIAVIALGIAALAGRLSWDWAIKIILGIVLIFGASTIVDYIINAAGGSSGS